MNVFFAPVQKWLRRIASIRSRMKTLVVFYSRTGITRKVAEHIARILLCDVEEIIPVEDRTDFLRYALLREEAFSKTIPAIKATTKRPCAI